MPYLFYFWIISIILFVFGLINFNISFRYSAEDKGFDFSILIFSILVLIISSILYNKTNPRVNKLITKNFNFIILTPFICTFLTLLVAPISYLLSRDCSMLPIERQCGCIYMFASRSGNANPKAYDKVVEHNKNLYNLKCEKGRF